MSAPESEVLMHTLVELSKLTEQLATVDSRETEHFRQVEERLGTIDKGLNTASELLAKQRKAIESFDGFREQVKSLVAKLGELVPDDDADAKAYRPSPAPRWWKLQGEERDKPVARLTGWVEQIYRPMYGNVATLGPCWQQHPLCLFTLDWLSELWSALYLQNHRSRGVLASQAEFQTRYLPAAAEQMALETTRCEHARPRQSQRLGAP